MRYRMGKQSHCYRKSVDRRRFCSSIATLAIWLGIVRVPFGRQLNVADPDQDYVIVNGWVLRRDDLATMKRMPHVV